MTQSEDRIELRGLRIAAICGLLPEERERAQPLEIDLDVYCNLSEAGSSDSLDDTIDYGSLCADVEQVVLREQPQLLEHLANRIAEAVMEDVRISMVSVGVRKLRPPVAQLLATAGVRIHRIRHFPQT